MQHTIIVLPSHAAQHAIQPAKALHFLHCCCLCLVVDDEHYRKYISRSGALVWLIYASHPQGEMVILQPISGGRGVLTGSNKVPQIGDGASPPLTASKSGRETTYGVAAGFKVDTEMIRTWRLTCHNSSFSNTYEFHTSVHEQHLCSD
jgi:hypothetical protein